MAESLLDKVQKLKKELIRRFKRLEEFPEVPAIKEHGIPEVDWIYKKIKKIIEEEVQRV